MSKNQDYIAKVRYQNDLPPPLLPPKLLKYKIKEAEEIDSSSLLSNLYRKQNVNNLLQIDNDFGLSIDLTSNPEIFGNPEQQSTTESNVKLHPNDQVLLRDPGMDRAVKNEPHVLFLRRTEYIGSQKSASGASTNPASGAAKAKKPFDASIKDIDTPVSQLRSIEQTFENATKSLSDFSKLRHPLKKNLKAKKVWSLLPDITRIDQAFSTIRASNLFDSDKKSDETLENGLFREVKLEGNDIGQVSIYKLDKNEELSKLKDRLNKLNENDETNEDDERFKFLKQGDYELRKQRMDNTPVSNSINDRNTKDAMNVTNQEIKEIALRFDQQSGIVYYNIIQSKSEVKKRKLNDSDRDAFYELDMDELNLRIKEPTVQELNIRNNKRHKFDDINYESIEIEIKEDKAVEESNQDEEDDLEELSKQD